MLSPYAAETDAGHGTAGTGPPPPFDPELAAALAVGGEMLPPTLTPDLIP